LLGIFPPRYKDELLYSIIARHHELSASSNFNKTLYDFFGSKVNIGVLPRKLEALRERLPVGLELTALEIIQQHTLFPYFRPFLSAERADRIEDGMLHSVKWGAKEYSGIVQSLIKFPKHLQLCLQCILDDTEMYKEAYWHRSHQLPGISVCALHSCKLIDSDVFINPLLYASTDKNALYVVKEAIEKKYGTVSSFELKCGAEHEMVIAKGTHWLLNNDVPILGSKEIKRRYKFYLKKQGYVTVIGEVKLKQLADDFEAYYTADFLNELHSNEKENAWMYSLFRPSGKLVVHPLRHILLMDFLGITPKQFFMNHVEDHHPFGEENWICLNPAAKHHGQRVVKVCKIYRETGTGMTVGRFTCECGFVFTRRGPDKSEEDKHKIGLVQEYGPIWEQKLLDLRDNEKLTYQQISIILQVTPQTASRFYKKLKSGMSLKKEAPPLSDSFYKYQAINRERWLAALKKFGGFTKTQLIKLPGSGYLWLYKHDREWLNKNSPNQKNERYKFRKLIDWKKRDILLARKVIIAAKKLKNTVGRPVKLTMSSIGRVMGEYVTIQPQLKRLPRTKKALKSVVDSVEDYQIRKLRWAAKYLTNSGEPIKGYRIKQIAAISSNELNPNAAYVLDEIIEMY
jgi:hypothetical protein